MLPKAPMPALLTSTVGSPWSVEGAGCGGDLRGRGDVYFLEMDGGCWYGMLVLILIHKEDG